MLHGKKMILVPHETLEQVHTELPKAPAPVGSYSKMDSDMEAILNSKDLSDYDKWVKYDSVLQRYMSKLGRQKRDVALTFDGDLDKEEEITPVEPPLEIESKPFEPEFKSNTKNIKAMILYNLLRKAGGASVTSEGLLSLNGEDVGSLKELLSATLSKGKASPVGWDKYKQFLKKLNVPKSYIVNEDLKRYLKGKPDVTVTIPRKLRNRIKWEPYNGKD
jgi:hypothetical protein